jgi:hypothetical protein
MPTTGIQRRPATSRTRGFTNRATNRTARRARGPRLIVLTAALALLATVVTIALWLMNQGRATA